jgi:hypothetical protein
MDLSWFVLGFSIAALAIGFGRGSGEDESTDPDSSEEPLSRPLSEAEPGTLEYPYPRSRWRSSRRRSAASSSDPSWEDARSRLAVRTSRNADQRLPLML